MINLGVIGLGYWGQRHVKSARSSGRFTVTRAADLDPEVTADYAEAEGIDLTADVDALLGCLLYTSPSPRDGLLSRMPSSA